MTEITPEILLNAYASGLFPMARERESEELFWFSPDMRGIIPLDKFHIPVSLKKFMKKNIFEIKINSAFEGVMRGCAARKETWINEKIISLYTKLHEMGFAHSVECWRENELVGGLYGVALGKAFFGESMFSKEENASKVALVYLIQMLKEKGFTLLDTQYLNEHLKQFGAIEIPKDEYMKLLERALT